MSIKVILVDDHKIVRSDIHALLESQKNVEVIAEAINGQEAIELANKLSPDIVIMDINVPNINGIEATRRITAKSPTCKIIALSMHSDRPTVDGILKAGASGFILKEDAFEDLSNAIVTVAKNEKYLSPKIATLLISGYLKTSPSSDIINLTKREREVLILISQGLRTKEIAWELNVSVKTIESHRAHIMDKLQIFSIAELTKFAIREGLATVDE